MRLFPLSLQQWIVRQFAWSNSRQSWQERGGSAAIILAATGLFFFGDGLPIAALTVAWLGLLAMLATLMRRGWVRLFGPVFFYDLICHSRRRRFFLLRAGYIVAVSFLLFWFQLMSAVDENAYGAVPANQMAELAEQYFTWYMVIQFVAIALFTPAYTAGCISEEKDRKTLEFLLATDLRDREIVFGKLAARALVLLFLMLAGMPILGLIQFMGGVDPNLVLLGSIASAVSIFSLAAVSVYASVASRRTRDALLVSYLAVVGYFALSGLSWLLLIPGLGVAGLPSTSNWSSPVTVEDGVYALNAGNPISALVRLSEGAGSGASFEAVLLPLFRDYLIFHLLLGGFFLVVAILRLRATALRQLHGVEGLRKKAVAIRASRRIWDRPMMWKELVVDSGPRLGLAGKSMLIVLVLACFAPAVYMLAYYLHEAIVGMSAINNNELQEGINIWIRGVGTMVACLLLLSLSVRAAGSIRGELDRQTFDSLLTCPLEANEMFLAKWLGSVCSGRWMALWLLFTWLLGLLLGGLHIVSLPLLALAVAIFAGFATAVGLWFSMAATTTLRAVIATIATLLILAVGHWLVLGMCLYMPIALLGHEYQDHTTLIAELELFGFTPPWMLGFLAFQGWEFEQTSFFWRELPIGDYVLCSFAGLACWALGAVLLGFAGARRFARVSMREAMSRGLAVQGSVPTAATTPRDANE